MGSINSPSFHFLPLYFLCLDEEPLAMSILQRPRPLKRSLRSLQGLLEGQRQTLDQWSRNRIWLRNVKRSFTCICTSSLQGSKGSAVMACLHCLYSTDPLGRVIGFQHNQSRNQSEHCG